MTEGFDLYDRLRESPGGQRIIDMFEDMARERDGSARQCQWACEDDWYVIYTTTRVQGGKHHGSFVAQLMKPIKKDGKVVGWKQDDRRVCSTRREAKDRALKWYREHSPKWDARHPAR